MHRPAHLSHAIHRWAEFSNPLMFTGLLLSAVVLKIIFHHMTCLARALPESCVLIVVGVLSGVRSNTKNRKSW